MWLSFGTTYKELRLLLYLRPIAGPTHKFLSLAVEMIPYEYSSVDTAIA